MARACCATMSARGACLAGLELSKQTEGELAKRNHVYQKTIKTLLAKLKQQDVAKRDEVRLWHV